MTRKNPLGLALKKLARRSYSRKEIEEYLQSYGYEEEIIIDVLNKLLEWGYLNDSRLAESMLVYYTTLKPSGSRLIAMKMNIRGIPSDIQNNVLSVYTEGQEFECCRRLAYSFASRKSLKDRSNLLPSLSRFLERKGFASGMIYRIIHEAGGWAEELQHIRSCSLDSSGN